MTKKSTSLAERELDKAKEQFDNFDQNIKEMTMDRMNQAPKQDSDTEVKLSQKQIENSREIYLKPERAIGPGRNKDFVEKFNEDYREDYNYAKEYVNFIAYNKEILSEDIEIWTKPFPGVNCEFWKVPVNKPVWGPRYLAEQIKRKSYHRLSMQPDMRQVTGADGMGKYFGSLAVDTTIQRLDAQPVSSRKSVFTGAGSFK